MKKNTKKVEHKSFNVGRFAKSGLAFILFLSVVFLYVFAQTPNVSVVTTDDGGSSVTTMPIKKAASPKPPTTTTDKKIPKASPLAPSPKPSPSTAGKSGVHSPKPVSSTGVDVESEKRGVIYQFRSNLKNSVSCSCDFLSGYTRLNCKTKKRFTNEVVSVFSERCSVCRSNKRTGYGYCKSMKGLDEGASLPKSK